MLAGITTAGWIAISVCIGICLGCLGTLTLQCCWARRRRRQYAPAQHTGAGAVATGGKRQQPLRPPAANLGLGPLAPAGIEYRPPPALAPPHTPSVVKYFSPLSAKGGPLPGSQGGALQTQQLTASHVRISVDAGDILALQACDQGGGGGGVLLQRDASYAGLAQSHPCMVSMTQQAPPHGGPLSSQAPLCLSTSSLGRGPASHSMQHHPQPHPPQLPPPAGCTGSLAIQQLRSSQILAAGGPQQHQQQHHHGRASYAALPPAPGGVQGVAPHHRVLVQAGQQHHGINIMPPAPQPAHEDSGYAAASGIAGGEDSVSSFASSGGQPAQHAAAAAMARSPRSSESSPGPAASAASHGQPLRAEPSTAASRPTAAGSPGAASTAAAAGAAGTASEFDLDDEYEVEDLDADWRQLLGDLDGRLAAAGAAPLTSHERAVAIKQLLQSTGTRGVDAAMGHALAEILHFRSMHGRR